MADIKVYPTEKAGSGAAHTVTGTDLGGDKFALDVAVGGGSLSLSGLSVGGLIRIVPLTDVGWTLLASPALTGRNNLTIQNQSDNGGVILWNYVNTLLVTDGYRIVDGGHKSVAVKGTIAIYGRMQSGTGSACVDEVA